MTERPTCDVCEGSGYYPVFNKRGKELYAIQCPDCFGSGKGEVPEAGPDYEYPASTAAKMKSQEDLQEWMASQ